MFLCGPPAPATSEIEFQWLWLADSVEGIGKHCFHKFEKSQSQFAIGLDQVGKVFTESR